jgi:hypothetical protein
MFAAANGIIPFADTEAVRQAKQASSNFWKK